jgi:hypothetical protein
MSPPPGESFELEVFHLLLSQLQENELGLDPKRSKVYHRRGYFSSAREKEIIFDVTVEVTLRGASKPSIIWVWECKDYESLVPVDDVEEFHAKLEQIGADNTKGTIVTRRGFQQSALKYANSKGIGLARIFPANQIDWMLHRGVSGEIVTPRMDSHAALAALTDPTFTSVNRDFFGVTTGFRFGNWPSIAGYIRGQLLEWEMLPDAIHGS